MNSRHTFPLACSFDLVWLPLLLLLPFEGFQHIYVVVCVLADCLVGWLVGLCNSLGKQASKPSTYILLQVAHVSLIVVVVVFVCLFCATHM